MNDHYYSKKPASKLDINEIKATINKTEFTFKTSSGVFAKEKADNGTLLLIESCKVENKEGFSMLDLGCGYGIVGIALKKLNPKMNVTCSDVNERAIELTQINAKLNNVETKVVQSDIFQNLHESYDAILVNLPQNAGKELCFAMIEQSFQHLNQKGTLQAVSRHQKGGKEYEKKMIEIFGNCEHIGKGSGYRVYMSIKKH